MSDYTIRCQNLSKHYLNEATADVFFICGVDEYKERVPAHKFVLFGNSDVFHTMFHGSLPKKNEIEIPDATPNGFRTFLRYFYFEECMLTIDVVGEVMYLAKKYNIGEYFDQCCTFLRKIPQPDDGSAKHFLVGYELAIDHELSDLKFYLEEHNDHTVLNSIEDMRSIRFDSLKRIVELNKRGLYLNAERLFDACLK